METRSCRVEALRRFHFGKDLKNKKVELRCRLPDWPSTKASDKSNNNNSHYCSDALTKNLHNVEARGWRYRFHYIKNLFILCQPAHLRSGTVFELVEHIYLLVLSVSWGVSRFEYPEYLSGLGQYDSCTGTAWIEEGLRLFERDPSINFSTVHRGLWKYFCLKISHETRLVILG